MKINTAELSGAALDWAVGTIEYPEDTHMLKPYIPYGFLEDWAQGGPIIEREHISLSFFKPDHGPSFVIAAVSTDYAAADSKWYEGPIPLIAAMRCFVASKLGEEVEVSDELLKP